MQPMCRADTPRFSKSAFLASLPLLDSSDSKYVSSVCTCGVACVRACACACACAVAAPECIRTRLMMFGSAPAISFRRCVSPCSAAAHHNSSNASSSSSEKSAAIRRGGRIFPARETAEHAGRRAGLNAAARIGCSPFPVMCSRMLAPAGWTAREWWHAWEPWSRPCDLGRTHGRQCTRGHTAHAAYAPAGAKARVCDRRKRTAPTHTATVRNLVRILAEATESRLPALGFSSRSSLASLGNLGGRHQARVAWSPGQRGSRKPQRRGRWTGR